MIFHAVLAQPRNKKLEMMKIIVLLATLVAVAIAIPADTYNPQYDHFNADELVENVRLLKNYMNCMLDKGPCTAEGSDFKRVIPEALATECGKCTPKQRELVRKVVHAFKEKLPELWQELVKKNDPTGQYKESFDNFLQRTD